MDAWKIFVIGFVVFSFLGCTGADSPATANETTGGLKKFNSLEEVKTFIGNNQQRAYREYTLIAMPLGGAPGMTAMAAESKGTSDYSATNIQVAGVDEADFVKTDGHYIYVLSGSKLAIVDAYPAEDAGIISETELEGAPVEFFVNEDDLVVFANDGWDKTTITHYDIADRADPDVEQEIEIEGRYFNSRMIGRHVYVITSKGAYYCEGDESCMEPPQVLADGRSASEEFEVYYFDEPAPSYAYTTVLSLDLDEPDEDPESKTYLMGSASDLYVSENNMYIVYQRYPEMMPVPLAEVAKAVGYPLIPQSYEEETAIHRLELDDGKVEYKASGEVAGRVLNQFSMDEHDGYFRIATTEGHVARSADEATAKNNVYVLDLDLEIAGELEDLAPGEQIYSARFMGDRAYLVTFRKVDPLFVIDLSDPEEPEVLGKLKIPGYSDYLHPYDENHIIGLGKDAIPADEGDFSWYQGLKLSLFDVSDVEHPREIAKYDIGDRGTESYALDDHKAFLFDREKNLLVIPVLLAELDEESYVAVQPSQSGEYVFQGAYVFNVDTDEGFKLKGRVSHADDDSFRKSGYYWYSADSVKRSLYIEDVLYTISDTAIKMNDLDDLREINEVKLPYEEPEYWRYME